MLNRIFKNVLKEWKSKVLPVQRKSVEDWSTELITEASSQGGNVSADEGFTASQAYTVNGVCITTTLNITRVSEDG